MWYIDGGGNMNNLHVSYYKNRPDWPVHEYLFTDDYSGYVPTIGSKVYCVENSMQLWEVVAIEACIGERGTTVIVYVKD